MNIPLVDLYKQYLTIQKGIDRAINQVIKGSAYIKGPYVDRFEKLFAKASSSKYCVSVANGTDALYITLKMLGIGKGDEVITAANSWISTSETITLTGAKPVFVDVEKEYFTIDPKKIKETITKKTKAVVPVHLFGQPADMDPIKHICEEYNLILIEDCAQAHLAEYKGKKIGNFGLAGTYSFFPSKNLGAYGDAGCITTNKKGLETSFKMYANHGALKKPHHKIEGINSRMDGMQAAILNVKLPHLKRWTAARIKKANRYRNLLKDVEQIRLPQTRPQTKHVYHLFVIRAQKRDQLKEFLRKNGISAEIHYPTPLPLLPAYKPLGYKKEDIPVANKYSKEILSLPLFPELETNDVAFIAQKIKEFYSKK